LFDRLGRQFPRPSRGGEPLALVRRAQNQQLADPLIQHRGEHHSDPLLPVHPRQRFQNFRRLALAERIEQIPRLSLAPDRSDRPHILNRHPAGRADIQAQFLDLLHQQPRLPAHPVQKFAVRLFVQG